MEADLQESRGNKIAEMITIRDKAAQENRDLSGEECKRFDELGVEIRSVKSRLQACALQR